MGVHLIRVSSSSATVSFGIAGAVDPRLGSPRPCVEDSLSARTLRDPLPTTTTTTSKLPRHSSAQQAPHVFLRPSQLKAKIAAGPAAGAAPAAAAAAAPAAAAPVVESSEDDAGFDLFD